jgi:hypothetical protein
MLDYPTGSKFGGDFLDVVEAWIKEYLSLQEESFTLPPTLREINFHFLLLGGFRSVREILVFVRCRYGVSHKMALNFNHKMALGLPFSINYDLFFFTVFTHKMALSQKFEA